MKKRLDSFSYAINGIKHCFKSEVNFRIHMLAAMGAVALGVYCRLSKSEWCIIAIVICLVVMAELFNTAVERLVDLISPELNIKAGLIKDLSAGAVLIAAVTAAITGILVFGSILI